MNLTNLSHFNQARIEWAIRLKYSPMPDLDMELIQRYNNAFRIGELRDVGKIWEIMTEIDGELAVNADKRASDLASLEWDIKSDGSLEGDAHKEALQYFYNHLTATEALEQDEVGGVDQLIYSVCWNAHLYRYDVHEMLMQISDAGAKQVTAEFRHTPIWFMECRRGYLGYLQHIFDLYGQPCVEGEWFTAVGRGWMRPLSRAYALKWFPMRDWLLFCQRYGSGFLIGETDAEEGTPEWDDALRALETLANDATVLCNKSTTFKFLEQAQKTHTPFEPLVERVDRLYSKCLRGVDLATSSRGGGMGHSGGGAGGGGAMGGKPIGANMQQEESGILLSHDVPWLDGYFRRRIDRPIIRYLFNVEPRAKFKLLHGEEEQEPDAQDTQTWISLGLPVAVAQARERTGWREPEDGEPILAAPATAAPQESPDTGFDPNSDIVTLRRQYERQQKAIAAGNPVPPEQKISKPPDAPAPAPAEPAAPKEAPRYQKPNWKASKNTADSEPAAKKDQPIAAGARVNPVQTASAQMPDTQVDASSLWSRQGLKPNQAGTRIARPSDLNPQAPVIPSLGYALPNVYAGRPVRPEVVKHFAEALADDLEPPRSALAAIEGISDPELFRKKIEEFISDYGPLTKLLADMNAYPKSAKVIQETNVEEMAAALGNKPVAALANAGDWITVHGHAVYIGDKGSTTGAKSGKLKGPNDRSSRETATDPSQSPGTSAHVVGGGKETTDSGEAGRKEWYQRVRDEESKLHDWAAENGKLGGKLPQEDTRGGEHIVQLHAPGDRVVKATYQNLGGDNAGYGIHVGSNESGSTPSEYLDRLEQHNKLFDDDVRVERVVKLPVTAAGPKYSIVTSQPAIKGVGAPEKDIDGMMAGKGFEKIGHGAYYQASSHTLVSDMKGAGHEDPNVLKTADGRIHPIDPIVQRADPGLVRDWLSSPKGPIFARKK